MTTTATISVQADGEISQLSTSSVTATPSTVLVDGVSYQWGQGENLQLDGFFIGNDEYKPGLKADNVEVLRRDIPKVAVGELCGIFAESQIRIGNDLAPYFPALSDQPRNCDMPAMLMSSIINRGTLDTFTNTGRHPNNIERIDYRFDNGILAPSNPDLLTVSGHIVGEKHGNNSVQVAAITALTKDGSPIPAKYGSLVRIGAVDTCGAAGSICYGQTGIAHDYVFFKSQSLEPLRDLQEVTRLREPVAFAFLSLQTLGITAGSTYYGISVFPHDINATDHDLLDISSFPDDTQEPEAGPNDSADIYGGSAFLYSIPLPGVTGRVFCLADQGGTEPNPNVPISLFRDTVADGVLDAQQDELLAELPGTATDGQYAFPGLDNGSYFVVVSDRADNDAASVAVVIDSSPVENADIFLDEPCNPVIVGPTAVNDKHEFELRNDPSTIIEVLENDRNASGIVDAQELEVIRFSDSMSGAVLEIQGRAVVYTLTQAIRDRLATESPIVDTFTYTLQDDQGSTSEAEVTVTITPPDDAPCVEPIPRTCLFVETEVDGIGVGQLPPLACLLLLAFVVMRRYALFATSTGDQS